MAPSTLQIQEMDQLIAHDTRCDWPAWVQAWRQRGHEQFKSMTLPTLKDEEWKYTNVSSLSQHTFSRDLKPHDHLSTWINTQTLKNAVNLVFINGCYSTTYSSMQDLPAGITVMPLTSALRKYSDSIESVITRHAAFENTIFDTLNNSLLDDGIYLNVAPHITTQTLIHVLHVTTSINDPVCVAPRSVISLGPCSDITLLESHVAMDMDAAYLTVPSIDIFLDTNAILHYTKAQHDSFQATHIGQARVWQERDARFNGFTLTTGGQLTRNNLNIVLNGEGCNSTLNGLYAIYAQQHVDNHTHVEHRFPNGTSNQLYKGLLNDNARAVFNGKIYVAPEAQLTNSYQLNKNLLLGKKCRVDTKPQLEIFADDVKCTHGATIGQLDENELFYLRTRCIDKNSAIKMLAQGFVDDLITTIPNKDIVSKLSKNLVGFFNTL